MIWSQPSAGPCPRFAAWALLLLMPPSPAAALSPATARLVEVGRQAQVLGSTAADAVLDQAANYWFAVDKRGRSLAHTGPALATAIRLARTEALRSKAQRIPADLKRALRRHYPRAVLDRARWIVAAPQSRLGQLLARWPVKEGAVTLDEIIVFKTPRAAGDRRLFAHELAHVDQYRKLGIDGFAARYAAHREQMEGEARAKAELVMSDQR